MMSQKCHRYPYMSTFVYGSFIALETGTFKCVCVSLLFAGNTYLLIYQKATVFVKTREPYVLENEKDRLPVE